MVKRKEIKFRNRGYTLEGRQGNLIFYLYDDNKQTDLDNRTYYVVIRYKGYKAPGMSTAGYRHFKLEDAKEFCQKIAAEEITVEGLLAEFEAEDLPVGGQTGAAPGGKGCQLWRTFARYLIGGIA